MTITRSSVICLLLLACAATPVAKLRAADATKPNILFLFADDQCYQTIHSLGNQEIETPNLDRLVRQGVTFTHTYNQGSWSGAVCVASRTMLNTGRFLWKAHAVYNSSEQERQAGRFWSEYMKRAGYQSYFTGKWHVKANAQKAFDVTAHVRGGMPNQTPQGYDRPHQGQADAWSPSDPKFGGFWAGGKHWSEVVADDAIDFLGQARQSEKPFFMYVAFNAPHDPRQSPQEYVDKYPLENIAVPESFLAEYPYNEEIGNGRGLRDERLAPFPRTEYSVKVNRQEYYAIITHMDAQIGRILDALEASGQADNTYIFFTADHGLAVGHHGLMGKQNMYDHSVRVPLIVAGPGVDGDRRIEANVYLQDVMPTTLELAGVERPAHVQFRSLLPLLKGEGAGGYPAIYGAYLDVQRMVTAGDWKLIIYPRASVIRLYNLADDPEETHDLADEPKYRAQIEELFESFERLQEEVGDPLELGELVGAG
jgi:arylsulfatase A-like enzyme